MFLLGIAAPHSPAQEFARKEGELSTIAAQARTIQVDDAFDGTGPPRIRRLLSYFRNALRDGMGAESAALPVSQTPSIAGRVADSLGHGIPGVSVIALHEAGGVAGRATTGSGGMYSINALPDGGYRVDFDLAGFDITRRNHVRVRAGETTNVDAILNISRLCECISQRPSSSPLQERAGYVVDESDRPLAHAWLSLGALGSQVGYADGEGRFQVLLPAEGTWPLTAFDTGFGTMTRQVSGTGSGPIVFKLKRAGAPTVPDTERLSRGCCSGDLFTHPPRTQSPD